MSVFAGDRAAPISAASFLRRVPVLAELDRELLKQLAEEARTIELRAGQWLVREDDPAESLFVIRSGRLEVISEGPPEQLIRVLRRGDVLGELALLQRGVRTASVRASRDSDLLELGRDQFEALIRDAPAFAVGLTRAMAAQLAASRAPVFATPPPRIISVIPLEEGADADGIGGLLATELERHGPVAELRADPGRSEIDTVAALDRIERAGERALLISSAPTPDDPWTDLCLREPELVIAVTNGAPKQQWIDRPHALRGCELLVSGAGIGDHVIERLAPREVQVIAEPGDLVPRLAATARRLTGRSLGVVLSGGGARAFAHLGVLEELSASGVVIDRVGAVSMGAIIGASFAAGIDVATIGETMQAEFVAVNPTGDYTVPLFSLVRGRRTRSGLHTHFSALRIESLPRRFFCLSCDLVARESVVHRTGSLYDAVRASLGIPGIFPPIATADGRLLVDGGVLDNLPVATMARTGEGPVIAVDVSAQSGDFKRRRGPLTTAMARPLRRYLTGSEAEIPRLTETIVRTLTVGSVDTAAAARRHAELVIQPQLEGIGLMDWRRLDDARAAGREAARLALATAPEWALG
jgi:predicted acylesterase/phospholipase RssA/CRP-like cAMP-binding protein